MKISKKQLLASAFVPVAVIFLSGCGIKQSSTNNSENTQNQERKDTETKPSDQLEQLPTDNKQAIDSEISNIDKELNDVDKTVSADNTDTGLGL
jgi:hypothetical protein